MTEPRSRPVRRPPVRIGTGGRQRLRLREPPPPPKQVLVLVAGTTAPVNAVSDHMAVGTQPSDGSYWDGYPQFRPALDAMCERLEFHDVYGDFSWSGHNNIDERRAAAQSLVDELAHRYESLAAEDLRFHVIVHSHGGQVINEATRLMGQGALPPRWKIGSISYLSTPFFPRLHRLDRRALARREYRLINVHNRFDLTQRVVADFSLRPMDELVRELIVPVQERMAAFKSEMAAQVDFEALGVLGKMGWMSAAEARLLWRNSATLFGRLSELFENLATTIDDSAALTPVQDTPRVLTLLRDCAGEFGGMRDRLRHRLDTETLLTPMNRASFLDDLAPGPLLQRLDDLLHVDPVSYRGLLFDWIAGLFADVARDRVEDTSPEIPAAAWQVNPRRIVDVPIEQEDPYHHYDTKTSYRLTARSIHILREPRLEPLKDQLHTTPERFDAALGEHLPAEELESMRSRIRAAAERKNVNFATFAFRLEEAAARLSRDDPQPTDLTRLVFRLVPALLESMRPGFDWRSFLPTAENALDWAEYVLTGEVDEASKRLRRTLRDFNTILEDNYVHIETEVVENNDEYNDVPEGANYLADEEGEPMRYGHPFYLMIRSHSVSRMGLPNVMNRVEQELARAGVPVVETVPA